LKLNLSQSAGEPLLNLGIISSKIINLESEEEIDSGYMLIDELRDNQNKEILVFQKWICKRLLNIKYEIF